MRKYLKLINTNFKGFLVTSIANLLFPMIRNTTEGAFSMFLLVLWIVANLFIFLIFKQRRLKLVYFVLGLITPVIIVFIIMGLIS